MLQCSGSTILCKLLVGNKCDCLDEERVVCAAEGEELAAQYDMPFLETSAKEATNVERAFLSVAGQIHEARKMALLAQHHSQSFNQTLSFKLFFSPISSSTKNNSSGNGSGSGSSCCS